MTTQAIPWETIENVFFSWVVAGSGLAGKRVIYQHQRSPRPDSSEGAFITMMFTEFVPFGYDWIDTKDNPAPSGDGGDEIIRIARGVRLATLSLEFFQSKNPDAVGALGMATLANVIAFQPFFRDQLREAGIGILEFGPGRGSPQAVPISLDPRVLLDIHFNVASEVQMTGTFIEFVNATKLDALWTPSTNYAPGQRVVNGGRIFRCLVGGVSADSVGPVDRDPDVIDGGVHWFYIGDGEGSDVWIPSDPTP